MQNASMTVQITIRNVPSEVREELAARAASEGKSLQSYLRGELLRIAGKPSMHAWLVRVRQRAEDAATRLTALEIVQARDADRK